jgi:hypothetical protein
MIEQTKNNLIVDHRLDTIENRLNMIDKRIDDLIMGLKIEFYNSSQHEYKDLE